MMNYGIAPCPGFSCKLFCSFNSNFCLELQLFVRKGYVLTRTVLMAYACPSLSLRSSDADGPKKQSRVDQKLILERIPFS